MSRRRSTIATTGFTLIEVTLVVAIIAVMAAMALPRMAAATDRRRADLIARKVAADLTWVQAAARARCTTATLTVDATGKSYTMAGMTDASRVVSGLTVTFNDAPFSGKVTPASTVVSFNSSGIPSASVTLTCTSGSASRNVVLTRPSGAITVQ